MGGVHAPESSVLWGKRRRAFLPRDPSVIVPWKKTADSSERSSVQTVVASLRISWAPSSLQLPRVLELGRVWAVFVLKSSLQVTIIRLSTSSGNCWMGCLKLAGLRGQKLNLQRLTSTLSSESSDRWNEVALGLVCQSIASLRFAASLASVLGGNCTKLVLWSFNYYGISMLSRLNTCVAFRSFNWQH